MSKTSAFAKLVSAVLFAAVCAYALAYFCRYIADSRYEVLTEKTVIDSIALEGIALRSEQLVCPEGEPVLFCESGERVSAGQIIAQEDGKDIVSSESALFFENCDGYEYLSVSEKDFSPERLNAYFSAEKHEETAAGRLVKGRNWYFAAIAEAEDIPCGEVTVKFEGFEETVNASLLCSCPDGEEKNAILLKIRLGKNEYLSLRRCRGEIILNEASGLAAPTTAVHEEDGEYFVTKRTVTGEISCPVDILYKNEDFVIIEPTDELFAGAKVKIQ